MDLAASAPVTPPSLPKLRGELRLLAADADGAVVHDPIRAAYFRIDSATASLLALWQSCATVVDLQRRADDELGLLLDAAAIDRLAEFLRANQLLVAESEQEWRSLLAIRRRGHRGPLTWLLHNYLFVRIPLVRPQRELEIVARHLAPLYTRAALYILAVVGLLGLYLVSRQWDTFLATFPHMFSLEGAAIYVVALVVVKSLHELGHAVTAVRYGCRVPTMGVSFMLLVPLLYTDVTDSWRLKSDRKRLAIDAAGLIVEFALALLALLAWAFLPDGVLRSLAFATATTGLLLSVGLNLNPFMRFDGYYILGDLTGFANLQPRAFAVGRWRMREWLFGLGEDPPEPFSAAQLAWLTAYAWMTWVYRLVLFTGIALLVYTMTFKLLGVLLFVVEMLFFIAIPIAREIREWHAMRTRTFFGRRGLFVSAVLAGLLVATFIPWTTRVVVPVVIEDEREIAVYARRPGRVLSSDLTLGREVRAGDTLLVLEHPELEQATRLTRAKRELVAWRLSRRAGDSMDMASTLVLEQTLAALDSKLAGLAREKDELKLTAAADGTIVDIDPHVHPGRWLKVDDLLAVIRGGGPAAVLRGYVGEADVQRIDTAATAKFVAEDPLAAALEAALDPVSPVGAAVIEISELASHYGGRIASRVSKDRIGPDPAAARRPSMKPEMGQFLVSARLIGGVSLQRVGRGTLHAAGRPESYAARAWRQVLKVLVRESGV